MAAKTNRRTKSAPAAAGRSPRKGRGGRPTKSQKLTRRAMERWDDDGGLGKAPGAGPAHDVVDTESTRK
jgi:hypothetical protein